jgi:hypothetical protein
MSIILWRLTGIAESGVVFSAKSDSTVQNTDKRGGNFDGRLLESDDIFCQRDKVFDGDCVCYWSCRSGIGRFVLSG